MLTDEQRLHQAIIISETIAIALHDAFCDSLDKVYPKLQEINANEYDMFGMVTHLLAHLIANKCQSLQEMTGQVVAQEMINRIHSVATEFLKDFAETEHGKDKPKRIKS